MKTSAEMSTPGAMGTPDAIYRPDEMRKPKAMSTPDATSTPDAVSKPDSAKMRDTTQCGCQTMNHDDEPREKKGRKTTITTRKSAHKPAMYKRQMGPEDTS